MNILFVAFTNTRGGAAKAALRTQTILNHLGQNTCFVSIEDKEKKISTLYKLFHYTVWVISYLLTKLQFGNVSKISLNLFGSRYILNQIKSSGLNHIHWINNETIRIKDFVYLSGKSVITLHDEWFYCGAEHHALDDVDFLRVVEGYTKKNKNVRGIDFNRLVWQRKVKYYPYLKNVIFTVPSSWMKTRAKKSVLLKNRDIRVIPNPINTEVFSRVELTNDLDGISSSDFVIAFGAVDGTNSKIKGFDLLIAAIEVFSAKIDQVAKIKILVFGGNEKGWDKLSGINVLKLGHIASEKELAKVYSRAAVTVVPSRVESFGQVAAESLSCQTPVLAFNHSGLTDIVKHKENGFLAKPFEVESLADGLHWLYSLTHNEREVLGSNGRTHIVASFSEDVVGKAFIALYNELSKQQDF